MGADVRAPFLRLLASAGGLVALGWARFLATGIWSPDYGLLPLPGQLAAVLAFVVLIGVAAHAYRELLRAATRSRALTGAWLVSALLLSSVAALTPPLLSNDLFSILNYADLWLHQQVNPLTTPATALPAAPFSVWVSPAWRDAPCVYGPLQVLWSAPAVAGAAASGSAIDAVSGAVVAAPLGRSLLVAGLTSLLAGSLLLGVLFLHCRSRARNAVPGFALVAFCPLFWIEGTGQGHNDLLVALGVALFLYLATRGRTALASLALGAAAAAKLSALLLAGGFLAFLLARAVRERRGWPPFLVATAVLAATLIVIYLPFWDGAATLTRPLAYLAHRHPSNTLALPVWQALRATGIGMERALAAISPLQTALTACIGGVALVAAWRARSVPDLAAAMACSLALLVTLGTSVFQPWYLLPVLVLALEVESPAWRRWLVLALPLAPLLDGSVLLAPHGVARPVYMAITVTMACLVWLRELRPRLAELLASAPGRASAGSAASSAVTSTR